MTQVIGHISINNIIADLEALMGSSVANQAGSRNEPLCCAHTDCRYTLFHPARRMSP